LSGTLTGFSGGLLYSNGNLEYAKQSASFGMLVGSIAGGIIGGLYGGFQAYQEYYSHYENMSDKQALRTMKRELRSEVRQYISGDVRRTASVRLDPTINTPAKTIGNGILTDRKYKGYPGERANISIRHDVLEMYFTGDKMRATSAYIHEWLHAADLYSGYANYIYSKYGETTGRYFLEMITYGKTYNIYGTGIGQNQMEDYIIFSIQFLNSLFNY
jgi:hypothetical protein